MYYLGKKNNVKMMWIIRLLFFIVVVPFYGWAQKNLSVDIQAARVICQQFMTEQNIPGMAVAISMDHEMIWSEGFGQSNLEAMTPVDPYQTKFRIGSISKSLTSAALALLYERGQLYLDTPIQFYLKDYPADGGKTSITSRLLAGHLAGIRHYQGNEFLNTKPFGSVTLALDMFKNDTLLTAPGTAYNYSSYGYNLLSAVLEQAGKKDFLTFMQQNIFDVLGMQNTLPEFADKIIPHRTGYYQRSMTGVFNAPFVDNSYKWAGGGFLSTAFDLLRFMHAMAEQKFIQPKTWQLITTPQINKQGQSTGYGMGWRTWKDKQDQVIIGHSGGSVGGTCNLIYYPVQKIAVVVLTNMSSVRINEINEKLAALFLD